MENKITACLSCKSLRKEISLTPGEIIYSGTHWQIEHAYPTAVAGWLVCVLRRHTEALHELTVEEWQELAELQNACVKLLRKRIMCPKEYVACFAEGKGFNHIHFHIVARPEEVPEDARGPKVFSLLGQTAPRPLSPEVVQALCVQLKEDLRCEMKLTGKNRDPMLHIESNR